jgi:large-conductance mechanosensitive channel
MKRIGFLLLAMLLFIGVQATTTAINVDSLKDEIINSAQELHELQKDSIVLSKLSPNQLLELKKGEQEVEKQQIEANRHESMPFGSAAIVIICLLPFLFVATLVFIVSRAKSNESKRKYDLYTKSLEMGQTIPDHFFDEPKKVNQSSNLKRGVLCLAVGLALLIYFVIVHNNFALIGGMIPAFVGVGYLLVHYLDKPKTDTTGNNDEQHG